MWTRFWCFVAGAFGSDTIGYVYSHTWRGAIATMLASLSCLVIGGWRSE